MSFIYALRNMIGDTIPVVNLSGMHYGSIINDSETINEIGGVLSRDFKEFSEIYYERVNPRCYTIEDVFHNAVLKKFDDVGSMRGVDIVYNNIAVHVRIVIDGADKKTMHDSYMEREEHIVSYQGSTVVVHYERFNTDEMNEYREYYIAM